MRELGYIEGENLRIEQRHADRPDQVAGPAAELVRLQPEVILVSSQANARRLMRLPRQLLL